MDRLKEISSTGTGFSATFDYAYNDANQRTVITNADNSRWVYVYDDLGQVISGKKYWSDGTPVAGQQFDYGFDDIGNRTATTNNTRVASYSANNVNQYTSRTVPGYVDVLGAAHSNATVTVNFQSTERKGEYFRKELSIENTNAAVWQGITNIGVLNDGSNPDIVTTNLGNVFLAQTPENFTHDLDGNLTQNGRFTFVWDGENRAVSFESLTTAPTASKRKVDCTYDYQSRRIQKIAYTNDGTSYVGQYTNKFIYDGWNLKAILDGQNALLYSFAWGSDLSGSMQGAGGVGGLISMTVHGGTLAGTYFYAFDGNGNVAKLVNGTDGSIAAEYEYDPFGRLLRATGSLAFINPFRFSTKYQDDETGFLYYGYRFYDADAGRWLCRTHLINSARG